MLRNRPVGHLRALLGAVTVLVLVATGCSGTDDAATPTPTPASGPPPTTELPNPDLLDPGDAPRRPLRLDLEPGTSTALVVTVDLGVVQEVDGAEQVLDAPPVSQTVVLTVDAVEGEVADVSLLVTDATVDAEATDLSDAEVLTLTAAARQVVGIAGRAQFDTRGGLRSFRYVLPDDLDPALAATLDQLEGQIAGLIVPLPEEAVGVGARWRVRSTTTLGGAAVDQITTYTVTDLDDDRIAYTAAVDQRAANQALTLPGLPDGTSGRLVSSQVTGTSVGTVETSSLASDAASTLTGTQVVDLDDGDGLLRLTQRLDLAVTVRPADGATT